ncbi:MAG: hypothetical protein EZS28_009296 [Streblomastix strix]|uniref:Uncharacterized protein n=1 Tax=Streblomastix strix TaxID=222440 RepID=A0A5J4WKN3_9EUKA|nr:MAG: hypothetical protein EZS28_009296 [Streblomastix strix]
MYSYDGIQLVYQFPIEEDQQKIRSISTISGLKAATVEELKSVGSEYCVSLMDSLPSRLDALREAKQGHTEY